MLRNNYKVQADLFEALVGAICSQSGIQVALVFAKNVLRPFIQAAYDDAASLDQRSPSSLVVENGLFEVPSSAYADSGVGDEEEVEVDAGPGFDINKGPSYVMKVEEWRKQRGTSGRDAIYTPGPTGGSSNVPIHSGHLQLVLSRTHTHDIGTWTADRGQKANIVKQK